MRLDETKCVEGFFISFEKKELEDVKKALDILGYTPDGIGMKELLLDSLYGEEDDGESGTESFIKKSREYIRTHPETINMGITALKNLANIFGKTRK
jgi:hypothetical protein